MLPRNELHKNKTMNASKDPSGDQNPFFSQESRLGSVLLTEVAQHERALMQVDLASCLLGRLEEWPAEPSLIYAGVHGDTTVVVPIGEQITVGRASGINQIEIPVPHLSKRHFQIKGRGDGYCPTDFVTP